MHAGVQAEPEHGVVVAAEEHQDVEAAGEIGVGATGERLLQC